MVRPHQVEEALATQLRVTVMAAEEVGEGQLLHMIPQSMFTKNSRPPHQVKTFQQNDRGKEMSLSRCIGLYYKLPKSDPSVVY